MNKLAQANKEFEQILKKYDFNIGFQLDFPKYKELPEEVQLAMSVIRKHGAKVVLVFMPKGEVKK